METSENKITYQNGSSSKDMCILCSIVPLVMTLNGNGTMIIDDALWLTKYTNNSVIKTAGLTPRPVLIKKLLLDTKYS